MFSTMIQQATLCSYLDLPEQVRVTPIPKRIVADKPKQNRTDKADSAYLDALEYGPLTVKQLAAATGKNVTHVQRQVRTMEKRELIKICGEVKNGANPAISWGVV